MKTDPRRFASLGLVLSAIAVLAVIVILVVRGLASAGIIQLPDPEMLNRSLLICLSLFILGLALTAFLDPERTREFLTGRQAKYGSNAVIMLLAFLGILLFINILAYQNPKSWDMTESQQNTLAPETITMLAALPQPIVARAYYTTRNDPTGARTLLDNLKQSSAGKFSYTFIDPEGNPVAAQQDGVSRDATVVLSMGNQHEQVNLPDEQSVDAAIIRLINPQKRVIYFMIGHGEADTEQTDDSSYSLIKTALENKNYIVKTLNLVDTGKVPEDANLVVIPGPQSPISADEAKNLQAYLAKGGALIAMENPKGLTKMGDAPDPLADLISSWGITEQNDILFDPNANPALLIYADPLNYGQHPITDKLRGLNSRFFTAQSLLLSTAPQGITLTPLAQTYPNAWGETDFASIQNNQVTFDQAKDHAGPLVIGAAGENSLTKARLVVFGDSDFVSNAIYKLGYGDIFVNAVDWATQQQNLINLTPKSNASRSYNPPGTIGLLGIILVSICLVPLLIVGGGFATWFSRRKRG